MILSRYYAYSNLQDAINVIIQNNPALEIEKTILGNSVSGRPIYGLKMGSGDQRIFVWSQMHGNESTTTRALINLLQSDYLVDYLTKIKLYIIPVLNPDGAESWTRTNANEVDLNRDAVVLSQPESILLRKAYLAFQPHYCLNLHGQRTIYGNLEGTQPAQLSFLSPAGDKERSTSNQRLDAMRIINSMVKGLEINKSAFIGRYSDDFNVNCVGDYFTSQGTPTILFEAGHAGLDYNRSEVTDYVTQALKICIAQISQNARLTNHTKNNILESYHSIPEMRTNYCDILIINMISEYGKNRSDLSIMYQELIMEGKLHFIPCVTGINDNTVLNGHRVIDLTKVPRESYDFQINDVGVISSTTFEILMFCE
jgi:hypothetical protein